jgi:excinuclease UvrABC nuclease subunit
VGSSINLSKRFASYFSIKYLAYKNGRSYIRSALLLYGYSSFSLKILEYCKAEECIVKEQYYLDLLKPDYNILLKAGSTLGRKLTPETREKLSKARKIKNNTIKATAAITKPVSVTDILTSKTIVYPSMVSAQATLKAGNGSFHYCLKHNTLYRKRYVIKLLPTPTEK